MSEPVKRFEDFRAWRQAMDMVTAIYAATTDSELARDFVLRDQMRRAAVSIASNIAEGYERGTRSEFHRFLSIAKGSCAELRTQIMIAARVGHVSEELAKALIAKGEELAGSIGKLRVTVAEQRKTPRRTTHASLPMPHAE
jgi:four helix bundle protein